VAASGTVVEGAGRQLFLSADGQTWAPVGEPIALAGFPPHQLESPAAVRRDCQQRFVVESITGVDGP